ncbi:hypothetical protein HN709_04110 [Candidatus Peregrinibacteria bacterium]|jgi:hypothetical protein|nr:hypothetical protein [Candidatus Peregrinibacteria bacterium]MBT7736849.1 hypothetical protein [Candidatus Peregrinibacteria bacterium]
MKAKIIGTILTLLTPIILTGCFGEEAPTSNSADPGPGKVTYESESYFIFVPEDWEIIERKDLPSDAPAEFQVAFKNNVKHDIFTASTGITLDLFMNEISSEDFMINSKAEIKNAVVDYVEISAEGNILVFEGKKSAIEPIIRFKTIYIMSEKVGYTITAAYVPDEDESVVNMTEEMLNSFTLK